MSTTDSVRSRRGRPRKFSGPSRAVTLTLPEEVIATLQTIDPDVSRAIVRIAQPMLAERPHRAAELSNYGDRAVITVPRSSSLRDRTGVELVPLSDGRALISFDDQLSIPQLELRIGDALADPTLAADDRALFEALSDILTTARRSGNVVLKQRSIIVLQSSRSRTRSAAARPRAVRSSTSSSLLFFWLYIAPWFPEAAFAV